MPTEGEIRQKQMRLEPFTASQLFTDMKPLEGIICIKTSELLFTVCLMFKIVSSVQKENRYTRLHLRIHLY